LCAATSDPELSVVILNWNVRDLLRDCLRSLGQAASGPLEIIVVDAASADGSAEMVRREFPAARLIASTENLGYSRGNNLGLAAARGRWLLVLNPDTRADAGALASLLAYAAANLQAGILGPQLLNPDDTPQSSRRRFPTLLTAFFESTWLAPLAPPALLDRYYARDLPAGAPAEVDWVTGACLLIRREVYEQIGGFDEGFFMYSEEMDYCRRAQAAGWRVAHVPQARVYHYEGKSSEQAVPERHIRFQRSKIRYFRKYHGPLAALTLRLFLLASYAEQLGLEAVKGLLGHKRELRRARVQAYWQVLRSGL
jgi:N-acetylglucosaminyl-diphospho-decaprenol L-rhamnosyltransferase